MALLPSIVSAQSQTARPSPLTTEALIGQAVSLSNQSYPDIDNAIQRFRNRDVQGARLFLEKAQKKHPNLPPADVTLAKMQALVRNHQAVHALLENAVVKYPADPEAYLILADQAFAGRRTTEASALFEKADTLIQDFNQNAKRKRNFVLRALAGRAAVTERRRQWEQAEDLLKQWGELDPENATVHQRYGVVLFRLKKSSEALEQFAKSRELNSGAPHPYVLVGKLFAQEGAKEKANTAFEKAYAEEKSNVTTAQAYTEWLVQDDRLEQAEQVINELLKQDPDSISSLILSSIIAQMDGNSDRAETMLQKVLTLDPSNASATNLLAQLLIEREDQPARERALSYAQANARQFPNNGQSNITLAWVLYKQGNVQQAQAALNAGLKAGGLSMDSTYLVARLLAEQQDKKEHAIQALMQVVNKSGLFIHRKQAERLLDKLQAEK
jgi:tetratricopeptide (TPR) repeat protein